MSMTGSITSAQRRRRWSAEEKARIVQDVGVVGGAPGRDRAEPGVHLPAAVCRGRAVGGRNRRTMVPFSEYRMLQLQVRERQRLLGKKRWRTRCCATRSNWRSQKTAVAFALAASGRHAVRTIADTRDVCPLQSGCASGAGAQPPASRAASATRGGTCRRDQGADCRPADPRLLEHSPCLVFCFPRADHRPDQISGCRE